MKDKREVTSMDDRQIIALFHARDEQAIPELTQKYGISMHRVSYNILKNQKDCEECVNDACLGVWNAIPPATPDPLLTFVLRIVRNISLARYKYNTAAKRNGHYNVSLSEISDCIPATQTVDDSLDAKALTEALNAWLKTLPKNNRYIFVRRYWYMDEVSDIAKSLWLSEAAVYLRIDRMKKSLAKFLTERSILI